MNRVLTIAFLFLTAAAAQSQAPLSASLLSSLQAVVTANKAVIDAQAKTLDTLNQLDDAAQQLKTFGKRG